MKFKKSPCLLLLSALLLTGCQQKSADDRVWMEELYLFRDNYAVKLNLATGTATSSCVDPLCQHEEGCPLAEIDEPSVIAGGDWLYWCIGQTLYAYDLKEGRTDVVYTGDESTHILPAYAKKQYLWFWQFTIDETGEGSRYIYSMYRTDRLSGKTECLAEAMKTEEFPSGEMYYAAPEVILGEYDDRLYLGGGEGLFTVNLSYGDRRKLSENGAFLWNSTFSDGYLYYMSPNTPLAELHPKTNFTVWENFVDESLYRMDCTTGTAERICSSVGGFALVGEHIYYVQAVENPGYAEGNPDTWWDFFAGNLYRMNPDGSESELVCTLPDRNFYCYPDNYVFLGGKTATEGDCLALVCFDWVEMDENATEYALSPATLIVNCATGEYTMAEVP